MRTPGQILSEKLDQALLKKAARNDRDYTYIHPSGIGGCIRSIVYEMLKAKAKEKRSFHEPRMYRVFNNGHSFHERLSQELEDAGILIRREVPLWSALYQMGGHTDDLILLEMDGGGGCLVLIEGKTAKASSYEYQATHGIESKYLDQLQVYLFMTGIEHGIIVMENKDTQERMYVDIVSDKERAARLVGKIKSINYNIQEGLVPAIPGDKKMKCFDCQWCAYNDECWTNSPSSYRYEPKDEAGEGTRE